MHTRLSILGVQQYDERMAGVREFGELIKSAREKQGMTGVDLANKIGRSHSMIVRWEKGQPSNPPDPDLFWDFCNALALEPEAMLESLGYLLPDETRPADNDALAALRPILDGKKLTDRQVRQLTEMVRGMIEMMEG